ncbi:hypothetical protein GD429_04050 [Burkholderia sp. BE17]|nr:hypothetical protein [Burkholderia sp. BE17]
MRLAAYKARALRIVGDALYDDPFRADQCAIGADFFDYPLAAFAHRLALVEAGCLASLPAAGCRRPRPAVGLNRRRAARPPRRTHFHRSSTSSGVTAREQHGSI